jgi:hypothetical protein
MAEVTIFAARNPFVRMTPLTATMKGFLLGARATVATVAVYACTDPNTHVVALFTVTHQAFVLLVIKVNLWHFLPAERETICSLGSTHCRQSKTDRQADNQHKQKHSFHIDNVLFHVSVKFSGQNRSKPARTAPPS